MQLESTSFRSLFPISQFVYSTYSVRKEARALLVEGSQ